MSNNQLTCFVISPIGDPGSEQRSNADDFFDLIVKPALDKYGFTVIRADKIAGTGSITEDVLRLVQESELCVVDLTFSNPNVFYECGRRHETGRPYIQLIRNDHKIPFDLSGIRTIKYSLTDARTVRDTVDTVQAFVEDQLRNGFDTVASGSSMGAISETLQRIERRLAHSGARPLDPSGSAPSQARGGLNLLQNPRRAAMEAIQNGDLPSLIGLLPRLEAISASAVLQPACIVAINGVPDGLQTLTRLAEESGSLAEDELQILVTSMTQYYINRDEEVVGVHAMRPLIERLIDEIDGNSEIIAHMLNQRSMLEHGAEQFKEARTTLKRAVELRPDEAAYHYNLSIIHDRLGEGDDAIAEALASINVSDSSDADHLEHAIRVLEKSPDHAEDAEDAKKKLASMAPSRAQFREMLGSVTS